MRKLIVLFSCTALLLSLAACGGKGSASSVKHEAAAPSGSTSSSAGTAGSSSSSAAADPAPDQADSAGSQPAASRSLTDVLNGTIGYQYDAAGSSLDHAYAATGIMDWFNDETRDPLADPADELSAWYNSLDEEQRYRFYDNWPHIRDQARAIADDPEGSRALLDSIANQNDYSSMRSGWNDFIELLDRLWRDNQPAAASY